MGDLIGQIKQSISSVDSKIAELEALKGSVQHKLDFTLKFLGKMEAGGYTKVSIGRRHKSVPNTVSWPFGHSGSVFGFAPKSNEKIKKSANGGWPPIWGVCEELGISEGAGNGDQRQANTTNLIDGVYHLKNGAWERVDGDY